MYSENSTIARGKEDDNMQYYHAWDAPAEAERGELVKVERNALNPLPGLTYVSIAYYTRGTDTYGIIF